MKNYWLEEKELAKDVLGVCTITGDCDIVVTNSGFPQNDECLLPVVADVEHHDPTRPQSRGRPQRRCFSGWIRGANVTIQAGCCGDFPCDCSANLDLYYNYQYIQSEELANIWWQCGNAVKYQINHTPILAGSVMGSILIGGWRVQNFTTDTNGNFKFEDVGPSDVKATGATLDLFTGELIIVWNGQTVPRVVVNYEYEFKGEK